MAEKYKVLGLMSGTSLDGLDMAYCIFTFNKGKWSYSIRRAKTLSYNKIWRKRLSGAFSLSGYKLSLLDREYGGFIGKAVNAFIKKNRIRPRLIASHGHTVFHQPEKKLTVQIGNGASIAAETGLPVVCDFRSLDMALKGQGAPLVPVGDRLLFGEYTACLNLGGFANISYEKNKERIAFDICPANIVLNPLALKLGRAYDKNGSMAKAGKLNKMLFDQLNALPYYRMYPPKSLGIEWVREVFNPVLDSFNIPVKDKLRTVTGHIGYQISRVTHRLPGRFLRTVLLSGGGSYNRFLIMQIPHQQRIIYVIPENKEIEFKEALIFAFLGLLRWRGEANTLQSVTGAVKNSSGGGIYTGFLK